MQSWGARMKDQIEEADYDFVQIGSSGWRCQDALDCERDIVAEAPTLGACILKAAEALGLE